MSGDRDQQAADEGETRSNTVTSTAALRVVMAALLAATSLAAVAWSGGEAGPGAGRHVGHRPDRRRRVRSGRIGPVLDAQRRRSAVPLCGAPAAVRTDVRGRLGAQVPDSSRRPLRPTAGDGHRARRDDYRNSVLAARRVHRAGFLLLWVRPLESGDYTISGSLLRRWNEAGGVFEDGGDHGTDLHERHHGDVRRNRERPADGRDPCVPDPPQSRQRGVPGVDGGVWPSPTKPDGRRVFIPVDRNCGVVRPCCLRAAHSTSSPTGTRTSASRSTRRGARLRNHSRTASTRSRSRGPRRTSGITPSSALRTRLRPRRHPRPRPESKPVAVTDTVTGPNAGGAPERRRRHDGRAGRQRAAHPARARIPGGRRGDRDGISWLVRARPSAVASLSGAATGDLMRQG